MRARCGSKARREGRRRGGVVTVRGRGILRLVLSAAFAIAGLAHLALPEPFLAITPSWVPAPGVVISVTGLAELFGAAGLLVPRTRKAAAWALAAYAVCVFPANVEHALIDLAGEGVGAGLPLLYHGPRLLFQPVIVWWCLFAGGVVDWPFGRAAAPTRP